MPSTVSELYFARWLVSEFGVRRNREMHTLAMNMMPPEIKPKEVRISVGGREGKTETGGLR